MRLKQLEPVVRKVGDTEFYITPFQRSGRRISPGNWRLYWLRCPASWRRL